jgi:hypothetical protein
MHYILDDNNSTAVNEKIQASAAAWPLSQQLPMSRPSHAHLGIVYGQLRVYGEIHSNAMQQMCYLGEMWLAGNDGYRLPGILPIGDDFILEYVRQCERITESDTAGLFDYGVQYGARRQEMMSNDKAAYEGGEWMVKWYGGENPFPAPVGPGPSPGPGPGPGRHIDPLQGIVRCSTDGAFYDNNGPCLPVGLHALDLMGQAICRGTLDYVLPTLDMAASLGYHFIRSGFQLKVTGGGDWFNGVTKHGWDCRDNKQLFKELLYAAAERQLKWNTCALGLRGVSDADEDNLFDFVAECVGEVGIEHFFQIEAANEVRDTGDSDDLVPAELESLINRVRMRHPEGLYALTAFTGHEDAGTIKKYTMDWMRHSIVHGSRDGHWWDRVRHIFSLMREGTAQRRYCIQNEPFGCYSDLVSASSNAHENDKDTMILACAQALMSRQPWTFMSGKGVMLESQEWDQMPGLAETPAIGRQLPKDLMRWPNLSHSGTSQKGLRVRAVITQSPNVREDYAIANDGRYVAVCYGPEDQSHDLPYERRTVNNDWKYECPKGSVRTGIVE